MDTQREFTFPNSCCLYDGMFESLVGSINSIALESQTLVLLPVDVRVHSKQVSQERDMGQNNCTIGPPVFANYIWKQWLNNSILLKHGLCTTENDRPELSNRGSMPFLGHQRGETCWWLMMVDVGLGQFGIYSHWFVRKSPNMWKA